LKILFSITNLELGGAQKFVLNLAAALSEKHDVTIYDHRPEDCNIDFINHECSSRVKIIAYAKGKLKLKLIWKLNKIFAQFGLIKNFRDKLNNKKFANTLKKNKFDIVHSHLSLADILTATALQGSNITHVTTLHGCYDIDDAADIDNYISDSQKNIPFLLSRLNGIIYLTAKSAEPFINNRHYNPNKTEFKKINNALNTKIVYTCHSTESQTALTNNSFVFGMVSRGLKEKGWQEALDAYVIASAELGRNGIPTKFIAIGGGEYLDTLKIGYEHNNSIIFMGQLENPASIIKTFDVGILPSYRECFPNVIIEYINADLAIIATDVGDIPDMVKDIESTCAILIKKNINIPPSVSEIAHAMIQIASDKNLCDKLKNVSKLIKTKFSIETCVNNHINFYKDLLKCK
jgi:L-malate glycosyltransferase